MAKGIFQQQPFKAIFTQKVIAKTASANTNAVV